MIKGILYKINNIKLKKNPIRDYIEYLPVLEITFCFLFFKHY